jgi:hypothetical protein
MPTKTATVASAKVAATLSNYPTYIDLSRVKGSAMTQAEADSVRIYTDSAKTTEIAREIVSVSECHAKIPSLTTTTQLWVDYDGVRSDYAATDTYGRNAVWSDYIGVWHLSDVTGSTGTNSLTNSGVSFGSSFGKIGNGADFDNTSDLLSLNDNTSIKPTTITISCWIKAGSLSGTSIFYDRYNAFTADGYRMYTSSSKFSFEVFRGSGITATGATTVSTNTYYLVHGTYDTSNVRVYLNGSSDGSTGTSGNITYSTTTALGLGRRTGGTTFPLTGNLDEARMRSGALSANWITTEYNNQDDESSFWPTWSDAGGAPVANNGFALWLA